MPTGFVTGSYVDQKNIFFYGLSRGGMMTFLALARGVTVNAAAVVGGIYDLQGLMEATKQRMPGVANRVMQLIPDYSTRGAAALAERSVMQWPEKLAVPLLMIHGADDEEVPVSQALTFAVRLSSAAIGMRGSSRGLGVTCGRGAAPAATHYGGNLRASHPPRWRESLKAARARSEARK